MGKLGLGVIALTLAGATAVTCATVKDRDKKIEEVTKTNTELEVTVDGQKDELLTTKAQLSKIESEKNKAVDDLAKLTTSNNTLKSDYDKIVAEKTALEADKALLQNDNTALEADNLALEQRLETLYTMIESLYDTWNMSLPEGTTPADSRADQIEQKCQVIADYINTQNAQIAELQNQITILEDTISELEFYLANPFFISSILDKEINLFGIDVKIGDLRYYDLSMHHDFNDLGDSSIELNVNNGYLGEQTITLTSSLHKYVYNIQDVSDLNIKVFEPVLGNSSPKYVSSSNGYTFFEENIFFGAESGYYKFLSILGIPIDTALNDDGSDMYDENNGLVYTCRLRLTVLWDFITFNDRGAYIISPNICVRLGNYGGSSLLRWADFVKIPLREKKYTFDIANYDINKVPEMYVLYGDYLLNNTN